MQPSWLEASWDGLYQLRMAAELLLRGHHSSLQEGLERGDGSSSEKMNHVIGIQTANWAEEALREPRLFHHVSSNAGTPRQQQSWWMSQSLQVGSPHLLPLPISAVPGLFGVQSVTMSPASLCSYSRVPSEPLHCCLQSLSLRLSLRQ